MIVIRLMGGLGNQMFQYATARSLANKRNTSVGLDLSWFGNQADGDTARAYELGDLNIKAKPVSFFLRSAYERSGFLGRVSRKALGGVNIYNEPKFSFNNDLLNLPNNTLLIGYFQTEKYFKEIREQLLEDFTVITKLSPESQQVSDKITNSGISVSVHVRRGDYVSNKNAAKFHGLKALGYYRKALRLLVEELGREITLFIFSDDPKWCKSNLKLGYKAYYVDLNQKGVEDMRLMSLCQHHILANSSFSWWGAWLNRYPDKKVVAPENWFAEKNIDTSDIIPGDWMKI